MATSDHLAAGLASWLMSLDPGPPMEQSLNLHESSTEILPSLSQLDRMLEGAIRIQQSETSGNNGFNPFRGLYITSTEVEHNLHKEAGAPAFPAPFAIGPPAQGSLLHVLAEAFLLSSFDVSAIVIALAPEIDLRYERLYAFLQDDVTRKRPTVDLALNLLCDSAQQKLAQRDRFRRGAPLVRHGIIHILPDAVSSDGPLLACHLKLDERIVEFLLGSRALDPRLQDFCRLVPSPPRGQPLQHAESACVGDPWQNTATPVGAKERLPLSQAINAALSEFQRRVREGVSSTVLHLRGGSRLQMRGVAETIASAVPCPLLEADLSRCGEAAAGLRHEIALVFREARLQHAIPYFENTDTVDRSLVSEAIAAVGTPVILGSPRSESSLKLEGSRVIVIEFSPLDARERRHRWEHALSRCNVDVDAATLDLLSHRYRLSAEQIEQAVRESVGGRSWQWQFSGVTFQSLSGPESDGLFAAARSQAGQALGEVAFRLPLKQTWSDLVLPTKTLLQLREFCARVAMADQVLGDWGFDRRLSLGKGATALFAGPSGTGKTMAAEVIGSELKLDLYRIDLAHVISKYIGETEKNLDRIFRAAENSSAILFFDEADALFGRRSEVRDSHDRYANVEISYLLQKLETYQGATILATNLSQNIDESFARRFAITIRFPFPDAAARERIWRTIWPAEMPLGDDIDFHHLADRFKLSGGNIKNAALAAAFLAAEDGGFVTVKHLLRAVEREYQKMGKCVTAEALAAEFQGNGRPNEADEEYRDWSRA